MMTKKSPEIAVLLATYNGERFVSKQLNSLRENASEFTLHWLDDQSTDDTRVAVRSWAQHCGIAIREWHQPVKLGVPSAYFLLLESVEADIYLFCDQDDIWQPGKIDATVSNLVTDLNKPTLCFTDPLLFREDAPDVLSRVHSVWGAKTEVALEESRLFMAVSAYANTQGFTRPLRDIFLTHKEIARSYAAMHDMWMYNIAVASGTARLLPDAPTTLYRWHDSNVSLSPCTWKGQRGSAGRATIPWREHQRLRRSIARHVRGFILASSTLPQSRKLDRLVSVAKLLVRLDQRQSLLELFRLVRRRVMWPNGRMALGLAAACLVSSADQTAD